METKREISKRIYEQLTRSSVRETNDIRFQAFHDGFWERDKSQVEEESLDELIYSTMYSVGKLHGRKWREKNEV